MLKCISPCFLEDPKSQNLKIKPRQELRTWDTETESSSGVDLPPRELAGKINGHGFNLFLAVQVFITLYALALTPFQKKKGGNKKQYLNGGPTGE